MKVLPKDIVIYLTTFLTNEETFKIFILNKYFIMYLMKYVHIDGNFMKLEDKI